MGLYEDNKVATIPKDIITLAKKIQYYRINKDYKLADQLRDQIVAQGYNISYDKSGEVIVKVK